LIQSPIMRARAFGKYEHGLAVFEQLERCFHAAQRAALSFNSHGSERANQPAQRPDE